MADSFTCPDCGMKSFNPNDIAYGYCGNCHDFTGEPVQPIWQPSSGSLAEGIIARAEPADER